MTKKSKADKVPKTKADQILNKVLTNLKIKDKKPGEKFEHIYKLFPELDKLNKTDTAEQKI